MENFGYWGGRSKNIIFLGIFFANIVAKLHAEDGVLCSTSSLETLSTKGCLYFGLLVSDDYFPNTPPETPISLRSSL